jgi:hypothetical protein
LCPISIHGSPVNLPNFQRAPRLIIIISSVSPPKKTEREREREERKKKKKGKEP